MNLTEQNLTKNEQTFLRKLAAGSIWKLRTNRIRPEIQSLIERGYCRTYSERIGPLRISTGEICIELTEAGRTALSA